MNDLFAWSNHDQSREKVFLEFLENYQSRDSSILQRILIILKHIDSSSFAGNKGTLNCDIHSYVVLRIMRLDLDIGVK